jgi:3-oxoacyl-[acyl-carrier protein] reductase
MSETGIATNTTKRTAFVTGAGRGIGRAHAKVLAEDGYNVGVTDVDESAAIQTADMINAMGGRAIGLRVDVSNRAEVEKAVSAVADWAGGIDVLVSNAGVIHSNEGLAETDDDFWHKTFAVHVDGALHTSRACLPWIERSKSGRMIFISSIWGQSGIGHSYAYCAAKGALMAFAKNAAKELGPKGISVNAVAPGGVHTAMTAELDDEALAKEYMDVPLRRYAEPEEIAYLVRYLASPEAAFMTGQTLSINGGQVIGGF